MSRGHDLNGLTGRFACRRGSVLGERLPLDIPAMSDDLPPPNTTRWVVRRKAAVIAAVHAGRITLEEARQHDHAAASG